VKAGGSLVLTADADAAARQAVADARASLGAQPPSFAVLFASAHFSGSAPALVAAVAEETGGVPLIGCVAQAVAGGAREVESGPAVSLWLAADLGPVETFAMEFVQTASGGAFGGYRFAPRGAHLMVCDPFTFPAGDLLAHLNQHVPGSVVMGGMASGGLRSGESLLFLDDRVVTHGAVGAHLPRAGVHSLVAQGCRPVGDPYIVTQADGNLIVELAGRPPLARLRDLATALPVQEQELLAQGVHLGIVIDEYRTEPGHRYLAQRLRQQPGVMVGFGEHVRAAAGAGEQERPGRWPAAQGGGFPLQGAPQVLIGRTGVPDVELHGLPHLELAAHHDGP